MNSRSKEIAQHIELAEHVLEHAFGPERAQWIERLEREAPNLRRSLAWLTEHGDVEQGLRLAWLLQELWFEQNYTAEGRRWLKSLLALPATAPSLTCARAFDLAGALALQQDDYEEARSLTEQGVAMFRQLGDRNALGYALMHLAHVQAHGLRDLEAAPVSYAEARTIHEDGGNAEGWAHAASGLANVALETQDYQAASAFVVQAMQRYQELGYAWDLALKLNTAAGVCAGCGLYRHALCLAGASAAHREAIGVSMPPIYQQRFERVIASARQALDAPTQQAAWEEGRAMSLEQAVNYALQVLHR